MIGDLWRDRTRALIVVLAIAIGLTGVLAVLSTYAILSRELNRGYLATNPASAVLQIDAIDDELLAAVSARTDIAAADARRLVWGRVRVGQTEWKRLVLFVIRDFHRLEIGLITPEAGEWPPADGAMLIERDAFQVVRAGIGDTVTVEISGGRERTLRISGRVHDPGQAQARMEDFVYGYITPATLNLLDERDEDGSLDEPAASGKAAARDRLYVIAAGDRFDAVHVRRVAADLKRWLESRGHIVRRMDVPAPGQHPHAILMGALLLAMAAFGLLVLILSGVIVVNLLLAIMVAERRQIGVMKAIGGSRGQIARIYLGEAGLLGAAAMILATPAGMIGGDALARYFAVLLNFDLANLAVPVWVYLLVVVVGFLVPLAAAAYPVAAGTDLTVRDALADAGVDVGRFGSRRLDRVLCGIGTPGRPLLLGLRNCLRRRARTALTLGTLSVAGAFFITALSLRASMMATLDRLFGAGTYGEASRYSLDQHMLMIYVFLLVVAGVLAAVGGLGLMTATSLSVRERRRELGVLRAIGATPGAVAVIVVIEALFIASISWTVALLAAWPFTATVGRIVAGALFRGRFEATLSWAAIAAWLGMVLVLSAIASAAPAMTAARRSVQEAVGYE